MQGGLLLGKHVTKALGRVGGGFEARLVGVEECKLEVGVQVLVR